GGKVLPGEAAGGGEEETVGGGAGEEQFAVTAEVIAHAGRQAGDGSPGLAAILGVIGDRGGGRSGDDEANPARGAAKLSAIDAGMGRIRVPGKAGVRGAAK